MWKRDDAAKPTPSAGTGPAPVPSVNTPPVEPARSVSESHRATERERSTVNIGKSVVIKGELTGSEEVRERLQGELGQEVLAISAVTGQGLARLVGAVTQLLAAEPAEVTP